MPTIPILLRVNKLNLPCVQFFEMDESPRPIDPLGIVEDVATTSPPIIALAVLPSNTPTLQPIDEQPPLALIQKEKCQAKGCPGLHLSPHTPLVNCSAKECEKQVHRICYEKMVTKSKKARAVHPTHVFCTYSCQDKHEKSNSSSHLHWRNDGKNGLEDPEHSENFIVQWLLTDENFNIWRSPPSGQTKLKVADRVAILLNTHGLRREITPQMVYNKIAHIEGQMRSTYDWCSGSKTGVGLRENDPLSFSQKVSFFICVFLFQFVFLSHHIYLFYSGH